MFAWRNGTMFWAVCVLLFVGSVAVTTLWSTAMSSMGGMPMTGNWTMSMAWMPMGGQTWPGLAASFLAMWIVMMVAMMLPSLLPILRRYRQALGGAGQSRLDQLAALIGAGYFFVWTVFGMAVFVLGAGFAALAMQQTILARAVPVAAGVVVVIAGALQFTAWKAHQLACCRELPGHGLPTHVGNAWRYGLRRGLHCSYCCAGLTAVLVVNGIMDLGVMAAVTVAITIERLMPNGRRVAQIIGGIVIAIGFGLIVRGSWPG
jgi:predicted metal-binding membrane protein